MNIIAKLKDLWHNANKSTEAQQINIINLYLKGQKGIYIARSRSWVYEGMGDTEKEALERFMKLNETKGEKFLVQRIVEVHTC